MNHIRTILFLPVILFAHTVMAQQQVTSMVTSTGSMPIVTYTNAKGAGQRTVTGALGSLWDSTGSNFTIHFNAVPNNITSLQQFNVAGHAQPFIKHPVNALVRIRRMPNAYVNTTRNHYNFWSFYSSIPNPNASTGTFNILGPEVTSPESAFLSNNLNSGYDNIFQNTLAGWHAGNIERLDFIVPEGVRPARAYDINNSGVLVLDRGTGDPFKVAAITSLNANNDPLTYGPLISVTAAHYGPNLMGGALNYCIFIHDPLFGNVSRPSTRQTQNMRGVFMSFSNLGVAVGQRIYGYSLFGQDVLTANPNWNTYPNATTDAAMLDPVNVLSFFRDISAVLPVPTSFELSQDNNHPEIKMNIYNEADDEAVIIERSFNGHHFEEIGHVRISGAGTYSYTDFQQLSGVVYYRLKMVDTQGSKSYSEIKNIKLRSVGNINISPNPARDMILISIPGSWHQKQVSCELFDITGSRIKQHYFTGSGMHEIALQKIKPGSYFIRITNETTHQSETRRISIIY